MELIRARGRQKRGIDQLLAGRYQLAWANAALPRTSAPLIADRLAISVTEVNGTYRDAGGRELTVLAQGSGRLQVAF